MYTLDDLVSDACLAYTEPVLLAKIPPGSLITSVDFMKYFQAELPDGGDPTGIKTIRNNRYMSFMEGLSMDNVLIAGGSIASMIHGVRKISDIDMFIYGLDESQATERVERMLQEIVKNQDYCELFRNNYCVTVKGGDYTYQIIFRLYKNIQEILDGFDIGCCCVGFDGTTVHLNERGKFSHEHNANIVDITKRSSTYEYRLRKYLTRGYSLVMPRLNVNSLKTQYFKYGLAEVCELPYLPFSYRKIEGNIIYLDKYLTVDEESPSDYGNDDVADMAACYANLYNLLHDKSYFIATSNKPDVLRRPPNINVGVITYIYNRMKKNVLTSKPNMKILSRYITVLPAHEIIYEMYQATDSKEYIDNLFNTQKRIAIEKMQLISESFKKIQWRVVDPGAQAYGSFNPITTSDQEWYGSYFL
jgi:hypothetical protein